MKKEYMKPQMEIVKIQLTQMLCESPSDFDSKSVDLQEGQVENENDIF